MCTLQHIKILVSVKATSPIKADGRFRPISPAKLRATCRPKPSDAHKFDRGEIILFINHRCHQVAQVSAKRRRHGGVRPYVYYRVYSFGDDSWDSHASRRHVYYRVYSFGDVVFSFGDSRRSLLRSTCVYSFGDLLDSWDSQAFRRHDSVSLGCGNDQIY